MNFEKITDKHTNSQAIQSGIGRVIDLHIPFQPELIGIDIRNNIFIPCNKTTEYRSNNKKRSKPFYPRECFGFIKSKSEKGSTK